MRVAITFMILITSLVLFAREASADAMAVESETPEAHRWGFETDLIWPFIPEVHIVSFRVSRHVLGSRDGARGDLLVGGYVRPDVTHDVVETIDEYLVAVGYRQYVWRGLNAELLVHGGWARGENNRIDGRDYEDVAVLAEANLGYAFSFWRDRAVGVVVVPQVGMIAGLYTNIGPREDSDFFITGRLNVGLTW